MAAPGLIIFDGAPEEDPEHPFCLICKMFAKQAAILGQKADCDAAEKAEGTVTHLPFDVGQPPVQKAQIMCLSTALPQLGLIGVCWAHAMGLAVSAVMPASQGMMPGPGGIMVPALGGG